MTGVEWRPFCGNTSCPCMEPRYSGACDDFVGEEYGNRNPRCGHCGWPEHHHRERPSLLTPRRLQVLRLLAEGKRVPVIAQELHVSVDTVKTHCKLLYRSLGAKSGPHAVHLAWQQGLLGKEAA